MLSCVLCGVVVLLAWRPEILSTVRKMTTGEKGLHERCLVVLQRDTMTLQPTRQSNLAHTVLRHSRTGSQMN